MARDASGNEIVYVANAADIGGGGGDGALESGGNLDDIATDTGNISQDTGTLATAVASEDSASQDADPGFVVLAVRKATATDLVSADGDYATLQIDSAGKLWVNAGAAADNAAAVGNPVRIGHVYNTAVQAYGNGDIADLQATVEGFNRVSLFNSYGNLVSGNANNTDGASTEVIAAQAAGVRTYVTDVTITNTSASMIYVELKDGTTVKWTFPVPATGGVTHRFAVPLRGTAATAWNFDPSAATTTVYCSAAGYTGA